MELDLLTAIKSKNSRWDEAARSLFALISVTKRGLKVQLMF